MSTNPVGDWDTNPNPTQICQVCGRAPHDEPTEARFKMICPGDGENVDAGAKQAFRQELGFRTEVAAAFGELAASTPEYVNLLAQRRRDAEDRVLAAAKWNEQGGDPWLNPMRSQVSVEALQADCDAQTVVAKDRIATNERTEVLQPGLQVDPLHLTVPGKVPERHSPVEIVKGPVEKLSPEQLDTSSDALLYVDPPEGFGDDK